MPARISTRRSISRKTAPPSTRSSAGELVVPLAVIDVRKQAEKDPDYLDGRRRRARPGRSASRSCRTAAASPCCRAGEQHVGDAAKFTGKDAGGKIHFPGIAPELAEWLLKERKVAGAGRRHAVARPRPIEGFQDPHTWLPAGRWGLENVANLEKLSPSRRILVVGLPKVKGSTGGPVRLIALI